jgi:hypothetical protein
MLSSLLLLLLLLLLAPRLIVTCFLALWRAKATLKGILFFRGIKIIVNRNENEYKLYLVV